MMLGLASAPAHAGAPQSAEELLSELLGAERLARADVDEARIARLASVAPLASDETYTEEWVRAQPEPRGGAEWECLTQALYFEARGETTQGVFAVAEVILNRVDSPRYPDTVCGVVHQGTGRRFACQFTFTCDGAPEHVSDDGAWGRVGRIAQVMLDGAPRGLTHGALFYHTHAVAPSWSRIFHRTATIGVHHFYR